MTLVVAILAGGLATRLRPITEKIPKALVEVGEKPFICHQLEYLSQQGISEVILCTGYLGDLIQEVVGDGSRFGLVVRYSSDGPGLLGTGGALRQALPLLGERFFVMYGDSYLPINFAEVEDFYKSTDKPALMTVLRNNDRWDKSNVLFQDGKLVVYDKQTPVPQMEYIDYGLGILSRSVLEPYSIKQPLDLSDIYHSLSMAGQLIGYEVYDRFYEIGSHTGLKETESFLTNGS